MNASYACVKKRWTIYSNAVLSVDKRSGIQRITVRRPVTATFPLAVVIVRREFLPSQVLCPLLADQMASSTLSIPLHACPSNVKDSRNTNACMTASDWLA